MKVTILLIERLQIVERSWFCQELWIVVGKDFLDCWSDGHSDAESLELWGLKSSVYIMIVFDGDVRLRSGEAGNQNKGLARFGEWPLAR